jgi:dienelactone hydrolase
MKNANADITFITYPGAIHSFTNPEADNYSKKFNIPLHYDPEADKQSWDKTQEFLNTIFKEEDN